MRISPATPEDENVLWLMLTYAASMDGGGPEQIERARSDPYLSTYVHQWGRMAGDLGVIARDHSGRALGAAWLRLSQGGSSWGVADQATPELATAVLPQARGQGIGTAMMQELIRLAAPTYRQITLSVRRENPALRFYKRLGFTEIATMKNRVGGDSIVMILALGQMDPFPVVFAAYPGVTQLDFTAPWEVFARLPGARCLLASSTGEDLVAEGGLTFTRVQRLREVESCGLLCVPGGLGTIEAMEDQELLAQIRRLAGTARFVVSVCTGALVLGAAGLLRGRRATTHWAWREGLSAFGATPTAARVVRDGPLFSGGGVTAGIDVALAVLAELAGDTFAQSVQLGLEYAPAPPFAAGLPEEVSPEVLALAQQRVAPLLQAREAAIRRAAARLA